jgi:hypothetical protein
LLQAQYHATIPHDIRSLCAQACLPMKYASGLENLGA